MVLSLCGCGSDGKYKVVKSLGSQEYSIGFRNGDSTYHYIDKAIKERFAYEGVIDELSTQWFGSSRAVDFPVAEGCAQRAWLYLGENVYNRR